MVDDVRILIFFPSVPTPRIRYSRVAVATAIPEKNEIVNTHETKRAYARRVAVPPILDARLHKRRSTRISRAGVGHAGVFFYVYFSSFYVYFFFSLEFRTFLPRCQVALTFYRDERVWPALLFSRRSMGGARNGANFLQNTTI